MTGTGYREHATLLFHQLLGCQSVSRPNSKCWLSPIKSYIHWVQIICRVVSPLLGFYDILGRPFSLFHHFPQAHLVRTWERASSVTVLRLCNALPKKPGWSPSSCPSLIRRRPSSSGKLLSSQLSQECKTVVNLHIF